MASSNRLASLDALRGVDMFALVLLHPVILALAAAMPESSVMQWLRFQNTHVDWVGFTLHDLVMPLFLFTAGVAIPLAMARFRTDPSDNTTARFEFDRPRLLRRVARRVALLWLIGMVIQGNMLGLDPHHIYLFSNTLQAIAVGYLFATLLYISMRWQWQVVVCVALMGAYAAVMSLGHACEWGVEYGLGSYEHTTNMAEYVDRAVLGRFRDGVSWSNGAWQFAPWYDTTWILSSLTFVVTVCTGVFAGEILLAHTDNRRRALVILVIYGIGILLAAWALSYSIPVIKRIWTPSMVLLSSGISVLLLAALYYVMDIAGWKRWAAPLHIVGVNAIAAYIMGEYFNFSAITTRLFYGLEHITPTYYGTIITAANSLLIFWVLWMMYRCGKFLKV